MEVWLPVFLRPRQDHPTGTARDSCLLHGVSVHLKQCLPRGKLIHILFTAPIDGVQKGVHIHYTESVEAVLSDYCRSWVGVQCVLAEEQ